MDMKFLIGMLNRPWFMEPAAARHWAAVADRFLKTGSAPVIDKRDMYTYKDLESVFRVSESGNVQRDGAIQVFRMNAPIAKYDYCGDPGAQTWVQHIAAANADPSVKAILLWMDSPGGQVDGTEMLANAVKNSAKPVVAFADSMMCSAAYWIGSSASEIIVDGSNNGWNATIGSIGTMAAWEDDSAKREKEGVKLITVFADDSSDKWGDYFARQQGDFTRLKEELNGLNATFLNAVKSNRAGKIDLKKENVLTGKTYNANEAIAAGLADRKGTFIDAVKAAAKLFSKTKISKQMSKSNVAFGLVMAAAGANELQVVDGGFLLTEEQLNSIEARLDQDATILSATSAQLKNLQAQEESFKAAEGNTEALATANARVVALEADLQSANEKIAALGKNPGANFSATNGDDDDPPDDDDDAKALAGLKHNQRADNLLPKFKQA